MGWVLLIVFAVGAMIWIFWMLQEIFATEWQGDAPCGWPRSDHPGGVCPLEGGEGPQ